MIKKQVLTAALLTAVLLLTGCLIQRPVTPSAESSQTLPDVPETEPSSEQMTFAPLPEILPIPPEYGTKGETKEAREEQTEPSKEQAEPSGEDSSESTEKGGTDIEGSSEDESITTRTTTTAPGPHGVTLPETEEIALDPSWKYADESRINDGKAVLYHAQKDRKNIVVGVNAGHGTYGGESVKTYCHPDHTPKVTGGTTAEGSIKAIAVSSGMDFRDGTPERVVTLKTAQYLRTMLLNAGYDVLMLRDGDDVQLDNVARTVICNQLADCHIAIHWDSDGLGYDKGAYFMSVPDDLKDMYPVSEHWRSHEALGKALIEGCRKTDYKVWDDGSMDMDLTQTSYSMVPSVDIEMGNEYSETGDNACCKAAEALFAGIDLYFTGEQN